MNESSVISEFLFTITELAAAFAGFATLTTVIARGYTRDHPRVDAFRLRTMLELLLSLVFFSLIPVVASMMGYRDETLWRVIGAAFCLWYPILLFDHMRQRPKLQAVGYVMPTSWIAVSGTAHLAGGMPLIWYVLTGVPGHGEALYAWALLMQLMNCGFIFMRTMASILSPLWHGEIGGNRASSSNGGQFPAFPPDADTLPMRRPWQPHRETESEFVGDSTEGR